ncbi:MAG: hypothetical protein ABFC34_05330 [Methanobacterium sp.]
MIFPPRYKEYCFDNRCTAKDGHPCTEFKCSNCNLAWDAYKTDLEDLKDWILPTDPDSQKGVDYFINEAGTIAKLKSIEDLNKRYTLVGLPFLEYSTFLMDQDELKSLYPYWYALKTLQDLGEPHSYKGGRSIPLIVEYSDCVYMIAPVNDSDEG